VEKKELAAILKKHKAWIEGKGGERADLQRADLQRADLLRANLRRADLQRADLLRANLRGADLRGADLRGADLRGADLRGADLQRADLQRADLQHADLQRADLRGADLRGADLDFSCMPMWCGGSRFQADSRIVRQLLAHIVTIQVDDADAGLKKALKAILPEAKKSHRAADLGLLSEKGE
jgi:uncharacterized protein YjbI with pentapeptide repeats